MQDYTYYFVPAPWLCVKLMKLLQCFPTPGKDILTHSLSHTLTHSHLPTHSFTHSLTHSLIHTRSNTSHSLSPLSSFRGRYSQVKTSRSYRCYSHKSTGNDPVIHTYNIYCMVYTAVLICLFLSQEPNKSKKIQHANSKNSVLFEAINLIVHIERYTHI